MAPRRSLHHVERVDDLCRVGVVRVADVVVDLRVLVRHVVTPCGVDVAFEPEHTAVVVVLDVAAARSTLDVAAADVRREHVGRRAVQPIAADLLRGQQRVVAADVDGEVVEQTRRRELRDRLVVHEHQLGIRGDLVADVVVRERAQRVALVGALEVAGGREVEQAGGAPRARIRLLTMLK